MFMMKRKGAGVGKGGKGKRGVKFLWGFAILIVAISVLAVFGENGLIDVYGLNKEKQALSSRNSVLKHENTRISEEIRLLKADKRYTATVARDELGMIGADEVLYIIEKD